MNKQSESQTTEFKCDWRDEYLRIICAFANTDGGKLIIGVNDTGKPIGVKNSKKLLEDLPNKIEDVLGIVPKVKLTKKGNKEIVTVEVEHSFAPISYHGKFYIRSGSTTQELKARELTRFLISRSGKDWEGYIEDRASMDDINIETLDKFRELSFKRLPFAKEERYDLNLLEKLNLIEDRRFKRAAILLFSKEPKRFYTSAYIKIGKFITDTDIVSTDDVEGNLFEQVEKAIELLRTKYLLSEIKFEGLYRKEFLEYPEGALREALINAVIHRDYIGAHTQLKVYPEKVVLWNEGKLPADIKIQDLLKHGEEGR